MLRCVLRNKELWCHRVLGKEESRSIGQLVKEDLSRCHDSTILFSLLCLPFSFSFTLLWVTWLYFMGHMSSHMMGSPDLSHDEGTWSVTWPWTIFTSHMSHYDSLLVFHLFLAYDSLYLISDSPGSHHIIDSYCHIIPYSMMSLHTCTYLFLVHL